MKTPWRKSHHRQSQSFGSFIKVRNDRFYFVAKITVTANLSTKVIDNVKNPAQMVVFWPQGFREIWRRTLPEQIPGFGQNLTFQ